MNTSVDTTAPRPQLADAEVADGTYDTSDFQHAAYLTQRNIDYNEDLVRHFCLTSAPGAIWSSRYDALDVYLKGLRSTSSRWTLSPSKPATMPFPIGFR